MSGKANTWHIEAISPGGTLAAGSVPATGDTAGDIAITGDLALNLRAERVGNTGTQTATFRRQGASPAGKHAPVSSMLREGEPAGAG